MDQHSGTERFDTVVIGGSQAGLATGYYLAKQGRSFVILEGSGRAGDGWRKRWDSLHLFTPAKYNGLPGLKFPAKGWSFPSKDEMADYLESYAEHFSLPVRTGVWVDGVTPTPEGYLVTAGAKRFEARNVVIASGMQAKLPAFASELDRSIVQIHGADYQGPEQLEDGPVLIVGLGNTGAEIGIETVKTHETFLSGEPSAQLPFDHGTRVARVMLPIVRFAGMHVLSRRTPIGRKVGPKILSMAAPLIRTKLKHLEAAGAQRVPRVKGVAAGLPVLEDGRTIEARNVIWATGYRYNFPAWINAPIFEENGHPRHARGVATEAPGLFFVGLEFQTAVASETVTGVGREAKHIAKQVAKRSPATRKHETRSVA